MKGGSSVPQLVLFVEELSDLLTESLPDLWKLGQAYFNGALIADVCTEMTVFLTGFISLRAGSWELQWRKT